MNSSKPKHLTQSWIYSTSIRYGLCLVVGLIALTAGIILEQGIKSLLIGWDVAIFMYVIWLALSIFKLHDRDTAALASSEDPGRLSADIILILASIVSLGAVGGVLFQANSSEGIEKWYLVGFGIISLGLSWLLVHLLFMVRYARLYYFAPQGGIDFNEDAKPTYREFAYLAFTVGMTYQVSDTIILDKKIRVLVLQHAFVSYLFGAVIVAVTINIVAGLSS